MSRLKPYPILSLVSLCGGGPDLCPNPGAGHGRGRERAGQIHRN